MSLASHPLLAKLIGSPALLSPFSHPSEPAISLSYQYRDLSSQKPTMTTRGFLCSVHTSSIHLPQNTFYGPLTMRRTQRTV